MNETSDSSPIFADGSRFLRLPKGFHDREGEWLREERAVLDTFERRAEQIGLLPLRTPILGFADTFLRGAQITGDKVFQWKDKSQRDLMLTPDSLPAVMRWRCCRPDLPDGSGVFFQCPVARYRNQANRFFTQIGFCIFDPDIDSDPHGVEPLSLITGAFLKAVTGDLGIRTGITLGHPGLLRRILERIDVLGEASDAVLRELKLLDAAMRENWIRTNLPTGRHADLLIRVLGTKGSLPAIAEGLGLEPDEETRQAVLAMLGLGSALQANPGAKVAIDLGSLHSTELQAGISLELTSLDSGTRFADGGSYGFYAARFDARIRGLFSICTGVEALIRLRSARNQQATASGKVLLLPTDCSREFARLAAEKLMDAGFSVTLLRTHRPKAMLQAAANRFGAACVLGSRSEAAGIIEMKNSQNDTIVTLVLNGKENECISAR